MTDVRSCLGEDLNNDRPPGRAGEVFSVFLRLGLTSFGGPVAHLGYFRAEFVERRRWLDDASYAELVALCQFLPGPASSQVGMAIGLGRAGWPGALAAWAGFTLPSAAAMLAFAHGLALQPGWQASGVLHGLALAAVAVVAQAVLGMARAFCTDARRMLLAVFAAACLLFAPAGAWLQVGVLGACALAGALALQAPAAAAAGGSLDRGIGRRAGAAALLLFAVLLAGLPALAALTGSAPLALVAGFYRAGALVFGGGHVVLPLLQSALPPGAVSEADFAAGYGAVQAVPGPLFSFAAYLGAAARGPLQGFAGGLLGLLAIFAPALLLVVGALPFWQAWRSRPTLRAAMAGVNAGVVGLLAAALWQPLAMSTLRTPLDVAVAAAAFLLLARGPAAAGGGGRRGGARRRAARALKRGAVLPLHACRRASHRPHRDAASCRLRPLPTGSRVPHRAAPAALRISGEPIIGPMTDPTAADVQRFIAQGLACEHLAVDGDGRHFFATIVSTEFEGASRIARHQRVYRALGDRMREQIHALSMKTLTPAEWAAAPPAAAGVRPS